MWVLRCSVRTGTFIVIWQVGRQVFGTTREKKGDTRFWYVVIRDTNVRMNILFRLHKFYYGGNHYVQSKLRLRIPVHTLYLFVLLIGTKNITWSSRVILKCNLRTEGIFIKITVIFCKLVSIVLFYIVQYNVEWKKFDIDTLEPIVQTVELYRMILNNIS